MYRQSIVYGIFEREKCDDDLREAQQSEIQIWKSKFGATGYYVSTVGLNTATVQKYIREQDQIEDSLSRNTRTLLRVASKQASVIEALVCFSAL